MKLFRSHLLVLLALAGVVLAACGSDVTGPVAATVNGHDITVEEVDEELEAITSNEGYRQAIEGQGVQISGEGEGTFDSTFVAEVLTRQIAFRLVEQELEDRGIEITEADRRQARESVAAQVGGQETFDQFDEDYQALNTLRTAQVAALQRALAGDAAAEQEPEAYYEANKADFEQACAHHILVETEEAANDVIARIQGGASFEDIARAESVDQGSGGQGGDLGCAPRGVYVPEFEEAIFGGEVGALTGPVQTQFGFHVIRVDERSVPPFEEVEQEVQQQLGSQGQEAFSAFLQNAFDKAEVDVNPRYGTWATGISPGVTPPTPPTTLAPGAGDTDGLDDLIQPPALG